MKLNESKRVPMKPTIMKQVYEEQLRQQQLISKRERQILTARLSSILQRLSDRTAQEKETET